jgi:hypothetical protein
MESAAVANMDFGANFVRILAVKVVHFQRVEKVMDIAVFAIEVIGETFVTKHAAMVVYQIVLRIKEIVAVALSDFGVIIVTKPACTTVPRQAVLD